MQDIIEFVNDVNEGVIFEIKILNMAEIYSPHKSTIILQDIAALVKNICAHTCQITHSFSIVGDKLYALFQGKIELLEELASRISLDIQQYNLQHPEYNIRYNVAALQFNDANKDHFLNNLGHISANYNAQNNYIVFGKSELEDVQKALIDYREDISLLKQAIINKTICFFYQPIVKCHSRDVAYYECLLRVLSQDKSYISTESVILNAEKSGLINLVDEIAIEMTIEHLVSDPSVTLAVNMSRYGVSNKYLINKICDLLVVNDVGTRLIIEITETAMNHNLTEVHNFIGKMHKFGVQIALDDFGSGFVSIDQMIDLPIDILKVDGKFIKNITTNKSYQIFVEFIEKLCLERGVKIVAEHVEKEEVATFISNLNFDYMQGFLFGRPQPSLQNPPQNIK